MQINCSATADNFLAGQRGATTLNELESVVGLIAVDAGRRAGQREIAYSEAQVAQ